MAEITFLELETGSNPTYSVIWMHGLGADGSDFEPIVPELGLPKSPAVRFVFPNAPGRPVTCNSGYVMPAWYDIISLAPENREIDEAGLVESMSIIRQFIAREAERGIPSHRVFLAGFSQGGAIAYSTALIHPERLAGVIALSTYIPSARLITRNLSAANSHLPIFAAHGLEDSVVSLALGEQAIKLIETYGYLPHWHTYPMEHEVCSEEIADIGAWLRQRIATQEAPSLAGNTILQPYSTVPAYITKDGSEIRELMHPSTHRNQAQSLAEATIHPGTKTHLHRHSKTEELYHITAGTGLMTLGTQQFPVEIGDTVLIPPGTPHCIEAQGETSLRILCCCSPAYDHADTELLS
jgi:phospholipase/carboxylesterase